MEKQIEKRYNWSFPSRLTLVAFGLLLGLVSCYDSPPGDMNYLDVSAHQLTFPAEGGSQTVVIVTEGSWHVNSIPFFLAVPRNSGTGPALLHISAYPNGEKEKRTEVLYIVGESRSISNYIQIEQEGSSQVQSDRRDDLF